MREFAESEIVVPDGPFEGFRFSCDRQPFTRLWFDAVDSGQWSRMFATGPSQSSKTLSAFVIPIVYHLFEIGETVICGCPDMYMAADKWRQAILPIVERSRYRELLPRAGGGSRGGKVVAIQFGNGATLRFMSGGGGDKSVAGYTSRVLVMTEIDGFDQPGEGSREADRVQQLEARTRAYGDRKRVYGECTVSVEDGRIWSEWKAGTQGRVAARCPLCRLHAIPAVTPADRKRLVGWQDAETELDARDHAAFVCSECHAPWTEDQRQQAARDAVLIHRGQSVVDGAVVGEFPKTRTLGFRWSAIDNMFLTAADIAADEWAAARATDEDGAERKINQFVWALPYRPLKLDLSAIDSAALVRRVSTLPRGRVPDHASCLTIGVDVGKWLLHYVVTAWMDDGSGHVVDYGRFDVPSADLGVEAALMSSLRQFRDYTQAGWAVTEGEPRKPNCVLVDVSFMGEVVRAFCRETKDQLRANVFFPVMGRGVGQIRTDRYLRPKSTSAVVKAIGEEYHVAYHRSDGATIVEVNADHWKSVLHDRLSCPKEQPGAIVLFAASPNDHLALAKHLSSERQIEEFIPERGTVRRWEKMKKDNHWFDAAYYATMASHFCGVRLSSVRGSATIPHAKQEPRETLQTPDGRPFFVGDRT